MGQKIQGNDSSVTNFNKKSLFSLLSSPWKLQIYFLPVLSSNRLFPFQETYFGSQPPNYVQKHFLLVFRIFHLFLIFWQLFLGAFKRKHKLLSPLQSKGTKNFSDITKLFEIQTEFEIEAHLLCDVRLEVRVAAIAKVYTTYALLLKAIFVQKSMYIAYR